MSLNERNKLFCKEYVLDFWAGAAAIRAGFSEKTAYSQGPRLLKNVEIQNEIARLLDEREKKYNVKEEQIIAELAKLALYDIGQYVQVKKIDGKSHVVVETTENLDMSCIQEVSESTGKTNTIKIKGYDKTKALELLMRYKGMLNDKLSLGGIDEFINGLRKAQIPPKPEQKELNE